MKPGISKCCLLWSTRTGNGLSALYFGDAVHGWYRGMLDRLTVLAFAKYGMSALPEPNQFIRKAM